MDRLLPTSLIVALVVIMAVLMVIGWRARRRRHEDLAQPASVPSTLAPVACAVEGWYVATTPVGEPLERIAARGLGFRARARVDVHAEGIVLDRRGSAPIYLPTTDLRSVGRATWAIDRVVEPEGLVVVGWMLGTTHIETYLRLTERSDADRLVAAVRVLLSDLDPAEEVAS